MSYVSWEYYSSLYTEIADQPDFLRLTARAEKKLDAVTHGRVRKFLEEYHEETATTFQKQVHDQIQTTVCELVNAMLVQESTGMGNGVSSVSNDGYSESYKITTAAEKEIQLLQVVRNGLSGTGLAGAL